MTRLFILWSAAVCVSVSGMFHVPSRVQYDGTKGSYFGFSLAYQKSQQKLLLGTPRIDQDGGVASCPIWPYDTKNSCTNILGSKDMNNTWGEFSREVSPNQHFFLGATVAATPDYLLTCAPLLTIKYVVVNSKSYQTLTKYPAIGRCFVQYNTGGLSAVTNPLDLSQDQTGSSLGWSSMVDQENDTLLISKPTGKVGTVMHTRVSSPDNLENANLTLKSSNLISDSRYIGSAMTSGVFFLNKGKIYANAWEDTKRMGYVGFLHFVGRSLQAVAYKDRKMFIKCKRGRNMFGASLHMADFSGDRYSELVVGAPAEPYKDEPDAGAIYIYRGGLKTDHRTISRSAICVHHNKAGSRFGTALTSLDLDGDDLPELFVSAPFEAKGGVVYVVSGVEVRALLGMEGIECSLIKQYYQILSSEHNSFGFVLQPALNFDDNGGNVLAVGAPLADKVIVYRSIPAVKMAVSLKLKDKDIVRELDKQFTVTVTITIDYPAKQKRLSGHLYVETSITTDLKQNVKRSAVPIIRSDQNFTVDLSARQPLVSRDIVVEMNDDLPHTYDFSASVRSDTSLLDKTEFDETLIRLSDNSVRKSNLNILRRCRGDECVPRLTMALQWSGQSIDHYVLGSSLYETVTVAIKNDGNSSYESCAKVKITGAKIADWSCDVGAIGDICRFQELKGSAEYFLNIKLDMSRVSYKTEELDVAVALFSKCSDEKPTKTDRKTIKYRLNTEEIVVTGYYLPLNVTDRDIADTTSSTVGLLETFTITNNGSVVWEALETEIEFERQPYIQDVVILGQSDVDCSEVNDTAMIRYICAVNLDAKAYVELKIQVNIAKNAVVKNLKVGNLIIVNTDIKLNIPTDEKTFALDATALYLKDSSFKNHKNYILIAAILVSILVLLIIAFILYKCGFFERNTKKELNEMKKEYRRRSTIRRPESSYQRACSDGELHIEEEDEAAQPQPTRGSQGRAARNTEGRSLIGEEFTWKRDD